MLMREIVKWLLCYNGSSVAIAKSLSTEAAHFFLSQQLTSLCMADIIFPPSVFFSNFYSNKFDLVGTQKPYLVTISGGSGSLTVRV